MILTRTPLRISLGGGGTDLPSYYREHGGFVISAAISKYVYIAVNHAFSPGFLLRYSDMERTDEVAAIRHPLLREALAAHPVPDHFELVSVADVPAGTGLGSSASFLVGVLHALYALERRSAEAADLAREAITIEMHRLGEPVGKQDQYIAAYGGLLCQRYREDDQVELAPLRMSDTAVAELRESLQMFYIGRTRQASTLLEDQKRRSEQKDPAMTANLHFIKELGVEIQAALEAGDVDRFGALMHRHWERKRERSPGMSSPEIDRLYELGRANGATGGKLVGAGGAGFLLFHTLDRRRLRRAMSGAGIREIDFDFDFHGSVVLLR